tara:strand:+ start:4997 stop:5230 length:234 start_codon:yes stop_codon:yes gene_type:complete
MSEENVKAEDRTVITLDEREYKESDLNDDQKALASELNVIARDMMQLEAQWNKLNRDKNYRIADFKNSVDAEEEKDD